MNLTFVTLIGILFWAYNPIGVQPSPTSTTTPKPTLEPRASPCHDFYDYMCYNKTRVKGPLIMSRGFFEKEVGLPHDFPFNKTLDLMLFDLIDPLVIAKWIVELKTMQDGMGWEKFVKEYKKFHGLPHNDQVPTLKKQLEKIRIERIQRFYNSVGESIQILENYKIPISKKNPFYHTLWEKVADTFVDWLKKDSSFSEENKKKAEEEIRSSRIIFAYYDYNNVTVWKNALESYKMEYHRLKSLIMPSEFEDGFGEKVIHLAALDSAIRVFKSYMTGFTEKFVFQSVIASPTNDCFNYKKEIHIGVLTRVQPPLNNTELIDIIYSLAHEMMHNVYNLDELEFGQDVFAKEKQCLLNSVNEMAGSDTIKRIRGWAPDPFYHEDAANMGAFRIISRIIAEAAFSENQIKEALETSAQYFCHHPKNKIISQHNPMWITINAAFAHLSIFNQMYQCKKGDRMFVPEEELCSQFNITQKPEQFAPQHFERISEQHIPSLIDSLNTTATAFDWGQYVGDVGVLPTKPVSEDPVVSSSSKILLTLAILITIIY